MSNWNINLEKQTATSINGITFKLTKNADGNYSGVCLNPKDIPQDDVDDEILARMIRDAGLYYDRALKFQR